MKNLSNIIERFVHQTVLLVEGRLEDAIAKNPDREAEIRQLAEADPSGNLKYLTWEIRQLKLDEPIDEIIEMTNLFHNHSNRLTIKDINRYITLADLREKIEELGQSKRQVVQSVKAGANKIYEDDKFLVVNPTTTAASQMYGKGTKWCIASTGSHNYFNSYSSRNMWFYFLIEKANEQVSHGKFDDTIGAPVPGVSAMNKIAIPMFANGSVNTGDLRDARDKLLSLDQIEDFVGESWDKLFGAIKSDLNGKGNTKEFEMQEKDRQRAQILATLRTTANKNMINQYLAEAENDHSLRKSLAANPNVDASYLVKYLKTAKTENDNEITQTLFANSNLPSEIIKKEYAAAKANDNVFFVDALISNPNLPSEVRDDIIFNGIGLETSWQVKNLVKNSLDNADDAERIKFIGRILASTQTTLSSSVFKILVNGSKNIEDLRLLLKYADTSTKKYFIKWNPIAVEYQRQKQAKAHV